MESARDARRRRILERGSDRMAFITGQERSLAPSKEQIRSEDDSGVMDADELRPTAASVLGPASPDEFLAEVSNSEDLVEKQDVHNKVSEISVSAECGRGHSADSAGNNVQTNPSSDMHPLRSPLAKNQMFRPKQISQSIAASQNIRLASAVILSMFVIIFSHNYNATSAATASIFTFRPLVLLICTDVTIVLGFMFMAKGVEQKNIGADSPDGPADSIGRALEIGLLLQEAVGALFMDCSVCAVIMICGLAV